MDSRSSKNNVRKNYFKWVAVIVGLIILVAGTFAVLILGNFGDSFFGSGSKEGIEASLKNKQNEFYDYFDSDDTVKDNTTVKDLQQYLTDIRNSGFSSEDTEKLVEKTKVGINEAKIRDELNTYVEGLSIDTVKSGLDSKSTEDINKKLAEFKKEDSNYYNLRLEAKHNLLKEAVKSNDVGRSAVDNIKKKADNGEQISISEYASAMEKVNDLTDSGYAEKLTSELKGYSSKVYNHNKGGNTTSSFNNNSSESKNESNNNDNSSSGNGGSLTEVINDYQE